MGLRMIDSERELNWIHAALSLLAPFIVVALTGCKDEKQAAPNFGPEVPPMEIEAALTRPMETADPSTMKVGEFVVFAETQTINNRSDMETVLSDTGQTVVNRQESADRILFTVVQNKVTYTGKEQRKTSTELEMVVKKATASSAEDLGEEFGDDSDPQHEFSLAEHARRVITGSNAPLKSMAAVFSAEDTRRVSYHNLRLSLETVSPPLRVRNQPNCLGIPDCKIRLHKIAFDQVVWASATEAEKVAFEFTMSPDVPYLAMLMDKCATLLVPVNEDKPKESTKVLLKQCSPVFDFRWEQ